MHEVADVRAARAQVVQSLNDEVTELHEKLNQIPLLLGVVGHLETEVKTSRVQVHEYRELIELLALRLGVPIVLEPTPPDAITGPGGAIYERTQ